MTDIRVYDISYEVVGRPQVRVTGGMVWTAPNITFGDLTQYHLWIGDRPLEPDEAVNGFRTFLVNHSSFSINQDFPLQSGSADVFIQVCIQVYTTPRGLVIGFRSLWLWGVVF